MWLHNLQYCLFPKFLVTPNRNSGPIKPQLATARRRRPLPLVTPHLLFPSLDLSLLVTPRGWSHLICGILCLAPATQHNAFEGHPGVVVVIPLYD